MQFRYRIIGPKIKETGQDNDGYCSWNIGMNPLIGREITVDYEIKDNNSFSFDKELSKWRFQSRWFELIKEKPPRKKTLWDII